MQYFGSSECGRGGEAWQIERLECKSEDDWVSVCRNVEVAVEKCRDRDWKTRRECVNDDTTQLGLQPELAVFRDMWRVFVSGQTLAEHGTCGSKEPFHNE